MKRLVAGCVCAGLVGMAAGAPQRAQAGEHEWATAGKILAGAVVVGALLDACTTQRETGCRQTTTAYMIPVCPPPPPVVYQPVHPSYGAWLDCHADRHHYTHRAPPCPPPPAACGFAQRVYQPPAAGHPALVQVWSQVENRWVTVQTQPARW